MLKDPKFTHAWPDHKNSDDKRPLQTGLWVLLPNSGTSKSVNVSLKLEIA